MTIVEALSKLERYFNVGDVKYAVKVGTSFVFVLYDIMQPIIVNDKEIRGLNGNKKEDQDIIAKAEKAINESRLI